MTHVSSAAQVSMDMDLWQVVAFGKDGSSGGRGAEEEGEWCREGSSGGRGAMGGAKQCMEGSDKGREEVEGGKWLVQSTPATVWQLRPNVAFPA